MIAVSLHKTIGHDVGQDEARGNDDEGQNSTDRHKENGP